MLSRAAARVSTRTIATSRIKAAIIITPTRLSSSLSSARNISPSLSRLSSQSSIVSATTCSESVFPYSVSRLSQLSLSSRVPSRWYSDAAKAEAKSDASTEDALKQTNETENKASSDSGAASELESLKKDVEAKSKEIISLKDQYLRSVADYRNLQERTKRETQAARDFALQKFAKDLVSSLDTFEHAISSVPQSRLQSLASSENSSPSQSSSSSSSSDTSTSSPSSSDPSVVSDLINLHKGLQLTESVFMDTLKRHGLTRFDPAEKNEKFDPNLHEAVFHTPVQGKESGTVFHTQQKGFLLNGRVIRAAQVGVVKND